MDADTHRVLAEAINGSSDTNRFVKDVQLEWAVRQSGACSNPGAGAILEVNGECWQHSHGDQLSVFDFTIWSQSHGGNVDNNNFFPIRDFARQGSATLHFPSFHTINTNWNNGFQIGDAFGRYGDWLIFDDLPLRVQTAGVAEAVGVGMQPAGGVPTYEMCGSAGEVATAPLEGHMFYTGSQRYSTYRGTQGEMLPTGQAHGIQFGTIHATLAVRAPDELRQRVAWSLAQVLVVGEFSSAVLTDSNEVWTYYYDILVRNAFGCYRDILWEVSFNPIMTRYLTFYNSGSYAYSSSVRHTAPQRYRNVAVPLLTVLCHPLPRTLTRIPRAPPAHSPCPHVPARGAHLPARHG